MIKKLFQSKSVENKKNKTIVVVSGLPRSGTSMMMKMLVEGGLHVVTDSIRYADEDNPNGYFELELVKEIPQGNLQWLAGADGKVVKIISQLLEYLPSTYRYKIIFMDREIKEVLASQQKMLTRRNEENRMEDAEMEKRFQEHLQAIKYWLARQPNMEVLYVNYKLMVASPRDYCESIAEFIGIPLNVQKMSEVPSEKLYRNRAPA